MSRSLKQKREILLETYGYKCAYCGCKLTIDNSTVDHIKPRIKGGTDAWENLLPACKHCNNLKTDLSIDDYKQSIINQIKELKKLFHKGNKFYFETI